MITEEEIKSYKNGDTLDIYPSTKGLMSFCDFKDYDGIKYVKVASGMANKIYYIDKESIVANHDYNQRKNNELYEDNFNKNKTSNDNN